MSSDEEKKLLFDIADSIERIEAFVEHLKNYSDYSKDLKSKYAAERMLIIIGEAVYKPSRNTISLYNTQTKSMLSETASFTLMTASATPSSGQSSKRIYQS